MAYLYRHIRLDKNEVFYIGIGSDNEGEYKRAYVKRNRSKYWKNIVSKTDYEVEIMLDDLTWEEACQKEIEFIKLYGRRDLNEGTLVNMTDGGDGGLGVIYTDEQLKKRSEISRNMSKEIRKKIGEKNLGSKRSEETKKKMSDSAKKRCTEEYRKKLSQSLKGKKLSEENKKKLSEARKEYLKNIREASLIEKPLTSY